MDDQRVADLAAKGMGRLHASTNVQVMALFICTWTGLVEEGYLTKDQIRRILDAADALRRQSMDKLEGQDIIARLRLELFAEPN